MSAYAILRTAKLKTLGNVGAPGAQLPDAGDKQR
jgi:hypothetical protein